MNKEQILQRLAEIREMMNDEEKRGDNKFSDLEKEVIQLKSDLEEIESRERLGGLDFGAKEGKSLQQQAHEDDEQRGIEEGVENRNAFESYLETRDIEADGLKTDEGYVVVPEDESKKIIELADDIVSLKQFVTVRPVTAPSGTIPVRTTARAKLSTVEELAKNPAIGVTPFTELDYKVGTKRGYIPYSEEYKQDGIELVSDLSQFIGEVVVNTENADILKELGTVRSQTVDSTDKLKTLVNTGFSAGKKGLIKFLMSQTVFDNFDRIKDKNGRYLLQESLSSETGYKLLGKDVVVLDDEYFEDKNTMFVGNLKEIVYFDRSQVRVKWTDYQHFGECLGVAIRNDVKKVEDEETKVNLYKVTVNIPTEEEVTP